MTRTLVCVAAIIVAAACGGESRENGASAGATELLNVSYDPTRELYQDVDAAFASAWRT